MNKEQQIETIQSSTLIAAIICCDTCGWTGGNEDFLNDTAYVAKLFYDDGWRVKENGTIACPSCSEMKELVNNAK